MGNPIDMTGQTYGYLTVLHRLAGRCGHGQHMWRVRCRCGAEYDAKGYEIRIGNAGSCRCRMKERFDITGQRFGRLTVMRVGERHPRKTSRYWHCRCDCGGEVKRTSENLRKSKEPSCGCKKVGPTPRYEVSVNEMPEYGIWHSMRQRCENPNEKKYHLYGGRGITVDERWQSFDNFLADMGRRPSPELSIDRIDNNAGYGPKNCRWATIIEQNANRRVTRYLTHDGLTLPLAEWSRRTGIPISRIYGRIKKGVPTSRILDPRFPLPRSDAPSKDC